MPIIYKTIPIDLIDVLDRRFCISYPLHDEALLSSVREIGIIQPVMLLDTTPYVVATGFKRIVSAGQLGLTEIPCVVVNISEKDALLYAIHDNINRGLNIIEKSHCIEKMVRGGFAPKEIHAIMALLSLNIYEKIIDRLIAVANAEEVVKTFILLKNLSMKNIESLLRFNVEERAQIIDILTSLHTTESLVREILETLHIIKIKTGRIDFASIKETSGPEELRKKLKTMTHPILSSLEEKLREIKLLCSLPPGIDIKVDPFFEKEYIDILIRAKTEEEIKGALEKLSSVLGRGYIRSIFELTKGRLRRSQG